MARALFAAMATMAIAGVSTAAAAGPRQVGSITYTSTVPGAVTGTVLSLEFQNPEDPSVKPHAVARMVVHSPVGAAVDTTVPPQCHAPDAQLLIQGAAACPPDTKIGAGLAVSDTGGGGPLPRYTQTTLSDFNNQDEIVAVGENNDIAAIKAVDHTKLQGNTSTTDFPVFPGLPPPDPYTPMKSLHVNFPPYVRGGRAYARTPPTCPAAGYWTITADFTYRDGVTQSVDSRSPCQYARAMHHTKKKHPKKNRKHRRPRTRTQR